MDRIGLGGYLHLVEEFPDFVDYMEELADKGKEKSPQITVKKFVDGRGVYLSGFRFLPQNVRLFHRAICWAGGCEAEFENWLCDNINTECAYYPENGKLVVVNNSAQKQKTNIQVPGEGSIDTVLSSYAIKVINM